MDRYGEGVLRRWSAIVVVVAVVVGGYLLWRSTVPQRPVAAVVAADSVDCAVPYPFGPFLPTPTATVPGDFVPVAAVTCDPFVGAVAPDRTVGFVERRWEGDFSGAVRLLNRASEHSTWFPGSCGEEYSLAVLDEFWLLDDQGRAVRPGYPLDSCGLPKPGGLAAIQELTPVGNSERRITLSDSEIEREWGCRPMYRPPAPGEAPLPTSLTTGSSWCRFSSTEFAGTTSSTETVDMLAPAVAPGCDIAAMEVASSMVDDPVTGEDRLITIEPDGCRRVRAGAGVGCVGGVAAVSDRHDRDGR